MQLKTIKVKDIVITKENPRNIDEKSEDFLLLCATVKAVGVAVPIHVEQLGSTFILKAGERRVRAAKKCGLKEIPALVYNTGKANGVMYLENFNRKNLTLFEKIKSIQQLMKESTDKKWLANQLAVSEPQCRQLINISKGLIKEWKDLIKENLGWQNWTVAMLALIAKQPKELQYNLIDVYVEEYDRECTSISDLQRNIDEYHLLLSSMPWSLDEKLKIVEYEIDGIKHNTNSQCSSCPNQTTHKDKNLLFDEISDPKKARCLLGHCYTSKLFVWVEKKYELLKKEHSNLIGVYPKSTYSTEYDTTKLKGLDISSRLDSNCKEVKESGKDAIPGIMLTGKNAGQLIWIRKDKVNTSKPSNSIPAKKPASQKTYAEKMKGLTTKRWYGTITKIIDKIEDLNYKDLPKEIGEAGLELMASVFGIDISVYGKENYIKLWKKYNSIDGNLTKKQLNELWGHIKKTITDMMSQGSVMANTSADEIKLCQLTCDELGIDVDEIFKEVCLEKGFTIPKSWKK